MPSFNFLPPAQIQVLAHYVRSLNADAFDIKPAGDATAGASIFFGSGHCSDCHTAQGRGGTNGPDLSRIGRLLTVAELNQSIEDPAARISAGYGMVDVTLRDGSVLRGFARNRTTHSIDLQTFDGRLHLMLDAEYTKIFPDNPMASGMPTPMPPFGGTAEQRRDLIAFLSTLGGVTVGPNLTAHESVNPEAASAVLHPRPGDWPTYAGNVNGNRYSPLTSINVRNVSALRPAWVHPLPYNDLETTPLVLDGVMYVTGPNQVYAIDGRTGQRRHARCCGSRRSAVLHYG